MQSTSYVTHPELEAALAHLDTHFAEIRTDIAQSELSFERTVHAQTRQMFNLLLPVYGGIIIGLLLFIASKVL